MQNIFSAIKKRLSGAASQFDHRASTNQIFAFLTTRNPKDMGTPASGNPVSKQHSPYDKHVIISDKPPVSALRARKEDLELLNYLDTTSR